MGIGYTSASLNINYYYSYVSIFAWWKQTPYIDRTSIQYTCTTQWFNYTRIHTDYTLLSIYWITYT